MMTKNRGTAEEGDDEVKAIQISDLVRDNIQRQIVVDAFDRHGVGEGSPQEQTEKIKLAIADAKAKLVQLGDTSIVQRDQANAAAGAKSAAELAKEQRGNAFTMQKLGVENDNANAKLTREYGLKEGLERAKNAAGGSNGKTDMIQLKTGRTATLNDLRQSYIANYGKTDPMGNLLGTVDGAPTYEAWVNGQAVQPVFTAQEDSATDGPLYAKAEAMAEKWVKEQAGTLSRDSSDFKQYGGNRQQALAAKTQEFYAMLKGGGKTKAAGEEPIQKLDPSNPEHFAVARELLAEAKGDKVKARQLAQERGYSF
jgi:hypothetical protein